MIYALVVLVMVNHPATGGCGVLNSSHQVVASECPSFTTLEQPGPAKSFATKAECLKAETAAPGGSSGWAITECIRVDPRVAR